MDIELADAVAAVRNELLKAQQLGSGQELLFEVGPIEMEFEVELRADAKAAGKFKVWALSAEAEGGVSRGRTHRISFTLTPRQAGRPDLLIASEGNGPRPPENLDGYYRN
ncbi:trypco2 family protein [Kitasatospora sp. NPDC057198]|uniref:trypco2 family protein n=1 Tax=Kitasatospora sp. NPDC057198 TaxID=3346046 RepID=UPI0036257657